MPIVLERQKPASLQPRNQQRSTLIPRPIKQLMIERNNGGISHASKPTVDTFPLVTPSKTQIKSRPIIQDEDTRPRTIPHDSDPELAILELVPFSQQPIVNFGQVLLGTTSVKYALLRNPLEKQQQLFVKTFPKADKGINIDATEFLIAPHTEICVALAWTPRMVGGIRESITLQDVNRMPKRIVLMGTATRPKPEPLQSRNIPRVFRRSPVKSNRQLIQERNKLVFSPRVTTSKTKKVAKPLTKLQSPSPQKRHQIVRKILSLNDEVKAIKIQSYCRMVLEKRRFKRMKEAIVIFQSRCRAMIARRDYLAKRKAAIMIQRRFRATRERRNFLQTRSAAILIQKHFRGLMARRERARLLNRLLTLRSLLRVLVARRRYLAKRRAAIIIQRRFRTIRERRQFSQKQSAAIVIQKYFRGFKARREKAQLLSRLIILQSWFREVIARREYLAKRRAAILIQRQFRAIHERRKYLQTRFAAIVIQKYFRGLKARRERALLHNRLLILQSLCRALIQRRRFLAKRRAAIIIQRRFRTIREREQFLQKRSAAIVIQKYFRGFKARQERIRLQRLLMATVWLQSQSRGYLLRQQLMRSVEAVLKIQARYVSGQSSIAR